MSRVLFLPTCFTVITTGETKQSSSTSFIFSKCSVRNSFSNSRSTFSCRCSGTSLAFFLFDFVVSWFQLKVYLGIFFVSLFSNKSRNRSTIFWRSDWLFSANSILPIVFLNVFIQSIPISGVMTVLSVISTSIFCFFFFRTLHQPEFSPGVLLRFC